jgi:protein-tyrosine phosphatase
MPENTLNFRDLGGLPAAGGKVRSCVLFRSEGPRNFAPKQVAALQAKGFRSIVDLRSAQERQAMPHDWHGPDCRWLQLDVNADLRVFGNEGRERLIKGPEAEIAISTMAETYREIVGALLPHWQPIARALQTGDLPMLLNCTAGKDRTGVAIALLLEMVGVSRNVILQDYLRSVIFAENIVRAGEVEPGMLASFGFMPSPDQVDALIGVRAEYLEAVWDEIAGSWDDVPSYFAAAGVSKADQNAIQTILVSN